MHPIRTEYFGLGPEPDGEARFLDIRIPIDENTPPDALLQFNLYAQIDSCIDESSRDCTGSAHGELGGIKVYGIY
ncbi:hypothetical protein KKG41_00710 [Patescibacteria group bacterium]|nr:hypothetical protein [Patescibacteria group bacterium]MBU1890761.1 hypothetical protein [Patescibacteria group bacterium]